MSQMILRPFQLTRQANVWLMKTLVECSKVHCLCNVWQRFVSTKLSSTAKAMAFWPIAGLLLAPANGAAIQPAQKQTASDRRTMQSASSATTGFLRWLRPRKLESRESAPSAVRRTRQRILSGRRSSRRISYRSPKSTKIAGYLATVALL